jgi:hypothetical protein
MGQWAELGRWRLATVAVTVFAVACALQAATMIRYVDTYDEGLVLYGAARVAQGDMPYRDFWSMYGPASFYVPALLFKLFGESVLTARAYDTVCRSLIVVLVWLVVRRGAGGKAALLTALASLGLLIGVLGYEFPIFPALVCALTTLWIMTGAMEQPQSGRRAMLAGMAAGCAAAFRHDMGVYTLAACGYGLCAWARLSERRLLVRTVNHFVIGLVLALAAPAAWLLWQVPLADLYEDLVRIPMQVYGPNRGLPFPSPITALQQTVSGHAIKPLFKLMVYLPLLLTLFAGGWAIRRRRLISLAAESADPRQVLFEMLVVLGLFFYLKGLVRVELLHMLPAALVALILSGWMLGHCASIAWRVGAGAAVLCMGAAKLHVAIGNQAQASRPHDLCAPTSIVRLRCFSVDADREAVLHYLATHTSQGDTLYVGTGRHDKLYMNNVELYFLSGMAAATKWHDLHPGVQTTREKQLDMVAALKRKPPRFVVLNPAWDDWQEPNASAVSSGVTLLDNHLRAEFEPVFTAGRLTVLQPRQATP